jgi:ERCC4-type nuclease
MKVLGRTSSLPERHGADVIFPANGALVGVQRKEISDLIASVQDGRLAKEIQQLQTIGRGVLVVEGRLKWSTDGTLLGRDYGAAWTRAAHRNLLRSVQSNGVWVESTDDVADTVVCILELQEYMRQPKHHALMRRPGARSPWGKADNKDWACHFLQGLEGVGPELASRIVEHYGRVPLRWDVTEESLREIKGVGAKKAKQMLEALG